MKILLSADAHRHSNNFSYIKKSGHFLFRFAGELIRHISASDHKTSKKVTHNRIQGLTLNNVCISASLPSLSEKSGDILELLDWSLDTNEPNSSAYIFTRDPVLNCIYITYTCIPPVIEAFGSPSKIRTSFWASKGFGAHRSLQKTSSSWK